MVLNILVVNAGSSTYKWSLFSCKNQTFNLIWEDILDFGNSASVKNTLEKKLSSIWEGKNRVVENRSSIHAVGHRVVNGGEILIQPTLITPKVKDTIRELIPLAPLHNPENLNGIEVMERLLPQAKQIAVFDTAFHHYLPEEIATYPLPYSWRKKGIRRYGFHGISHQYCTEKASTLLKNKELKIVCCHLGNGASLSAVDNGYCINTSMGFTPLEGLMMGTRSGSIDPGILFYLMREGTYSSSDLDYCLNYESGCKGICGTADMREITAKIDLGDKRAKLAYNMYVERLKMGISSMIASLGGIDVLIFTAGIGENSVNIRRDACKNLKFAGIQLDETKNSHVTEDCDISKDGSPVRILVINTQEELAIAKECYKFIGAQ